MLSDSKPRNSSTVRPAFRIWDLSVPGLICLWSGIESVTGKPGFVIATWLPRRRLTTKPARSKAAIASRPETWGRRGI